MWRAQQGGTGPSPRHPCEDPTHLPTTRDGQSASFPSLQMEAGAWAFMRRSGVGGTGFHMGQEARLLIDKQVTPNGDSVFPDSCSLAPPTQINAPLCLSSPSPPRLCMQPDAGWSWGGWDVGSPAFPTTQSIRAGFSRHWAEGLKAQSTFWVPPSARSWGRACRSGAQVWLDSWVRPSRRPPSFLGDSESPEWRPEERGTAQPGPAGLGPAQGCGQQNQTGKCRGRCPLPLMPPGLDRSRQAGPAGGLVREDAQGPRRGDRLCSSPGRGGRFTNHSQARTPFLSHPKSEGRCRPGLQPQPTHWSPGKGGVASRGLGGGAGAPRPL